MTYKTIRPIDSIYYHELQVSEVEENYMYDTEVEPVYHDGKLVDFEFFGSVPTRSGYVKRHDSLRRHLPSDIDIDQLYFLIKEHYQ